MQNPKFPRKTRSKHREQEAREIKQRIRAHRQRIERKTARYLPPGLLLASSSSSFVFSGNRMLCRKKVRIVYGLVPTYRSGGWRRRMLNGSDGRGWPSLCFLFDRSYGWEKASLCFLARMDGDNRAVGVLPRIAESAWRGLIGRRNCGWLVRNHRGGRGLFFFSLSFSLFKVIRKDDVKCQFDFHLFYYTFTLAWL